MDLVQENDPWENFTPSRYKETFCFMYTYIGGLYIHIIFARKHLDLQKRMEK